MPQERKTICPERNKKVYSTQCCYTAVEAPHRKDLQGMGHEWQYTLETSTNSQSIIVGQVCDKLFSSNFFSYLTTLGASIPLHFNTFGWFIHQTRSNKLTNEQTNEYWKGRNKHFAFVFVRLLHSSPEKDFAVDDLWCGTSRTNSTKEGRGAISVCLFIV